MLPLANRRILITRAQAQASGLAAQLEALGATTIQIPTIAIAPPSSYAALDAAITQIDRFDWLIFTSANAVAVFADRARHLGLSPRPNRTAAIGPATAKAVVEAGLLLNLTPPQAVAESLAESLREHAPGARMLLVRAAIARDTLPGMLTEAGASVTIAEAYRTVIPETSVQQLRELFENDPPDAITFTSASTAQNLVALLDEASLRLPEGIALASIGPITSQAMRNLGLEPTCEAQEATIQSLREALCAYFLLGLEQIPGGYTGRQKQFPPG
jgi:uroporphyrinogen-III synthase